MEDPPSMIQDAIETAMAMFKKLYLVIPSIILLQQATTSVLIVGIHYVF